MKNQILLMFLSLTISSCSDIEDGAPDCVVDKIKEFKESSICDDAKVEEFIFQGETIFIFEEGTCGNDLGANVINENCETIGYLGGITGNTKINGVEANAAKFVRIVWEK